MSQLGEPRNMSQFASPHLQVMQPDLLLGAHLLRYFGFADGGFSAARL